MKKLLFILVIIFGASTITSCNTVHGFGKDLGILGDKIAGKKTEQ